MTREEAIDRLTYLMSDLKDFCNESKHMSDDDRKEMESLDMAIKALEQDPCVDAISRADVKKYLSAPDANGDRVVYESDLDLLPPITPQPKTGHCEDCKWFHKLPYHAGTLGKCIQHSRFCPKGDWYCADFEPQESEG